MTRGHVVRVLRYTPDTRWTRIPSTMFSDHDGSSSDSSFWVGQVRIDVLPSVKDNPPALVKISDIPLSSTRVWTGCESFSGHTFIFNIASSMDLGSVGCE